jgi:hypothetical protein
MGRKRGRGMRGSGDEGGGRRTREWKGERGGEGPHGTAGRTSQVPTSLSWSKTDYTGASPMLTRATARLHPKDRSRLENETRPFKANRLNCITLSRHTTRKGHGCGGGGQQRQLFGGPVCGDRRETDGREGHCEQQKHGQEHVHPQGN